LLGIGVIAALVIGWQVAAFATGPVGTASGFEDDDGNLAPDPTGLNFDWNSFAPVTWSPHPATQPTREATATAGGWQFKGKEDWQATGADSAFAGGTKQDNNCASVISAKAPNKDDLKRIYLASKTDPTNGHVYLNLAWARIPQNTTSASAHIGFEFNQSNTPCVASQPNGLVQRTAGDLLIVYDFEGGTTEPVITLRRWITSGTCEVGSNNPPCWGPSQNLSENDQAEAAVNVGTTVTDLLTPPALSSTTGTSVSQTLGDSEFGEAGIDLTAANVIPANSCAPFGKAFAVSRSSGNSAQAQMKDLVGPTDFRLTNCFTNISSEQSFIPQDKATITGQPTTGFNGKVDFRLFSGLNCGDNANALFEDLDNTLSSTNSGATAKTDNDGTPDAGTKNGYTITGTGGDFSWKVNYKPDTAGGENHPAQEYCHEDSRVTIDNNDTVAPNPLAAVTT